MYKGIASKELIVKLGKAGLMGFLGTGGLHLERIESYSVYSKKSQSRPTLWGIICSVIYLSHTGKQTVELFLKYGIKYVEAAAYMQITPALVYYRLKGVRQNSDGKIEIPTLCYC